MGNKVRVLVVGVGNMGLSHAKAYKSIDGFELVGLMSRSITSRKDLPPELDLTGAPVIVFRHAGNGRMNIVYRRRDGNIGWIDPSTAMTA